MIKKIYYHSFSNNEQQQKLIKNISILSLFQNTTKN